MVHLAHSASSFFKACNAVLADSDCALREFFRYMACWVELQGLLFNGRIRYASRFERAVFSPSTAV
jgi:hypothetical protein